MTKSIIVDENKRKIMELEDLPILQVRDRIFLDGYGLFEIISKTYRPSFEEYTYMVIALSESS